MEALVVVENLQAASAITEFCANRHCNAEVITDPENAERLARFRRYTTVISDTSFDDAFSSQGLAIARAAKRRDPKTQTILLATAMSAELEDAIDAGTVDVVLMKPQPLSSLFEGSSALVRRLAEH